MTIRFVRGQTTPRRTYMDLQLVPDARGYRFEYRAFTQEEGRLRVGLESRMPTEYETQARNEPGEGRREGRDWKDNVTDRRHGQKRYYRRPTIPAQRAAIAHLWGKAK
jgi:hypothetical protein